MIDDNFLISSDFFGVTRELIEKELGCKVMLTQGACGNVKPKYQKTIEALSKMANEISSAINHKIDELVPHEIKTLSMFSQFKSFAADVPSLERAMQITKEAFQVNNIEGKNWFKEVKHLNAEGINKQYSEIEIQYFVIDNCCFCGVANEIMCELALDVAQKCEDDNIYFAGYTNGCDGYLPNAEEYDKGGYEVIHSYLIYYIYSDRVMPLNRNTANELVKIVSEKWNEINQTT